jgi:hypothetical protein
MPARFDYLFRQQYPPVAATYAAVIENQVRLRLAFLASKDGFRKKRRAVGDPEGVVQRLMR